MISVPELIRRLAKRDGYVCLSVYPDGTGYLVIDTGVELTAQEVEDFRNLEGVEV